LTGGSDPERVGSDFCHFTNKDVCVTLALPGVRLGRWAALSAVVLATLSVTATASAAPVKPYSIAFSANPVPAGVAIPGGMPAGVTIPDFTVTLRNDTKTQMLGSANLTVPAAFTLASAPTLDRGALIAPLGNTLQLRDLNVAPGGTVTLTVDLRLPCVSGNYAWAVQAKQSNDFSGTGNDLTPPTASALRNVVTGACALRFVSGAQPAGAGKTQQIRADAFQPTSTNLVRVEAVDGRAPALAQRLDWFGGAIALALGETTYPGELDQAGPVTATDGVASFSDISITAAGIYTLHASTTAAGFAADDPRADSAAFPIVDVVADCNALTCSAAFGKTSITGGGGSGTGFVLLSQNVGPEPICAGYTPPVEDTWYEFAVTAERAKTIVINYTKSDMRNFGNAGDLDVCFATPGPAFPVKGGGTAAPFDYDGDGSLEGSVGLLPDCPAVPTTPCVTDRDPLPGGAASIAFFVPADLGDPRYR
jgi:hypothetical protein